MYLTAPITYVGLVHANLLKALGNNDTISNLPSAMYLWMTIVPVMVAWMFPQPRFLKPLVLDFDQCDGRNRPGRSRRRSGCEPRPA